MNIIGLGTLAMDVLIRVDELPGEDGFCIIKSSTVKPGGSGTNVIVQCARLGADTGFIGAIGDDDIGRNVLKSLQDENVDVGGMVVQKGMTTLHTNIVIDDSGAKFIMLNMGDAFGSLKDGDINYNMIDSSKVFYTDLFPYNRALAALKYAKKKGIHTVFNMQVGMGTFEGMGVTREDILDCLQYVDVFAPCREGLFQITGTDDLDQCKTMLRRYCKGVLIFTLGRKGSSAYNEEDKKYTAEAVSVGEVIDTTGAGDSYIGSFMVAYYLRGYDLGKAMHFASVCAGYTCTGLGARYSPAADKADALFGEV
ncbi:carbohydrate kinase family protein [Lachnoclostridium sp. Marseille-P6806]|uniref:carbohydrate kinase family protein n=1 Tax=Lachnoclostridium sp. Marseille-P6806 TaxID=2364793 RepID=UPI0010326F5A|nr:carbohydrate kinase family protein [Lachnoclostridium sp. Marseille-P6806]